MLYHPLTRRVSKEGNAWHEGESGVCSESCVVTERPTSRGFAIALRLVRRAVALAYAAGWFGRTPLLTTTSPEVNSLDPPPRSLPIQQVR